MNDYWPLVDETWVNVALAICAVGALGIFLLAVRVFMDGDRTG